MPPTNTEPSLWTPSPYGTSRASASGHALCTGAKCPYIRASPDPGGCHPRPKSQGSEDGNEGVTGVSVPAGLEKLTHSRGRTLRVTE